MKEKTKDILNSLKPHKRRIIMIIIGALSAGGAVTMAPATLPIVAEVVCQITGGCL